MLPALTEMPLQLGAEILAAGYFTLLGWLVLRRCLPRAALDLVLVSAFPIGLAAWSVAICTAFALGLPLLMPLLTLGLIAVAGVVAGPAALPRTKEWGGFLFLLGGTSAIVFGAVLVDGNRISEDGRWYLVISEQLRQWQGMSPSLKAQLGTRPFLFPLLTAFAQSMGLDFFRMLEPLSAASCLAMIVVFGRRCVAASLSGWWAWAPVVALAVALALTPPFVWMAWYFNPHAEYALFFLAASFFLIIAVHNLDRAWLLPFAVASLPLSMIRVEGSLTASGLLVAALAASSLPLKSRALAVMLVGGGQALWHLFVLKTSFAHGGLTPYQIAIFGAAPGGLAGLAALVWMVAHRPGTSEPGWLRLLPPVVLGGLAAGAIAHELIWPFSSLRAAILFGAFLADPWAGMGSVIIVVILAVAVRFWRAVSPATEVVGTALGVQFLAIAIIAAHSPHQAPTITDSVSRMFVQTLPLLFMYPLVRVLAPFASVSIEHSAVKPRRKVWRGALLVALVISCVVLTGWLWKERGYLRTLPIPHKMMPLLYQGPWPALGIIDPASQPDLPAFDLETDAGLEAAVRFVRGWGPIEGKQVPTLPGTDTQTWLERLQTYAMYCTDAEQMMMLIAARQGLPVREINLFFGRGGWSGDAHSIMEFWSPRRGQWVAVDPHTATLYRHSVSGHLLGAWQAGRMVISGNGVVGQRLVGAAERKYDALNMLAQGADQMQINMSPMSWVGRSRWPLILGYVPMTPENTQDPKVVSTKVGFLSLCLGLMLVVRWGWVVFRSPD